MSKKNIDFSEIEDFLNGRDDQKYITNIEASYDTNKVFLIINDPITGKRLEQHTYKPFLWFNDNVTKYLCGGNRTKIRQELIKHGIILKKLKDTRDDGISHIRLEESFKYKATITKKDGSYGDLINFFKFNGVNPFSSDFRKDFVTVAPHEQFLISTGKRLFKGFEYYDDIHRLQFDLETTGLEGKKDRIFQIGIRDNRNFQLVLEVKGNTPAELRESEKQVIKDMFTIISELKPDVITAFNSENFDWRFIEDRCDYLFMPLHTIVKTLDGYSTYKTNDKAVLKLGGESEPYTQTTMWGYTILDISHAVRKAKAINSNIKKWNLKYITKYSKINKENRVYVPGKEIHSTWEDTTFKYAFNDKNGEYFKYDTSKPKLVEKFNTGDYELVSGAYIVQRYLKDDLWETEKVDAVFNEAEFLVSKILPTSFTRCATMGTAGKWNLIMLAWSFEKDLAIPKLGEQEKFTGGLARLLQVGFAKNVAKLDYAALYPNIQITHDIFPEFDMSGVMSGLLLYIASTRDKYKDLKNDNGDLADEYKNKMVLAKENGEDYVEYEKEYQKYSKLAGDFDKKQLPLKILANSFFGSFGAPYIFYWGDVDKAEEITCRGRQYLRLMVKHFYEKYNFEPLVGDTDGFNFAIPDTVNDISYYVEGTHRLTEKDKGKTLVGLKAVVADFNEEYMIGRMGLDIDEICESTINFARKNYGNLIKGKVKLVGASIKSDKIPIYIEEFIDKGLKLLLDDKGKDFLDLYYDTVERIYNYQIPLIKIASKSRVKLTNEEYLSHVSKSGKGGKNYPRQAHMELAIKDGLKLEKGQTLYYINTGESKSHGDIKTTKDENGRINIDFNSELLNPDLLESEDTFSDKLNVAKYIDQFNKKVEPLLVCFHPDIRDKVETAVRDTKLIKKGENKIVNNILINLVNVKVDDENNPKKKKTIKLLEDRKYFTKEQCKLVSGYPMGEGKQDDYYENLMKMDDSEIQFWLRMNKIPNNMTEDEWFEVKKTYHREQAEKLLKNIEAETKLVDDILRKLELEDYDEIFNGNIPLDLENLLTIEGVNNSGVQGIYITSKANKNKYGDENFLLKYHSEAKERSEFYKTLKDGVKNKYEEWLTFKYQHDEWLNLK